MFVWSLTTHHYLLREDSSSFLRQSRGSFCSSPNMRQIGVGLSVIQTRGSQHTNTRTSSLGLRTACTTNRLPSTYSNAYIEHHIKLKNGAQDSIELETEDNLYIVTVRCLTSTRLHITFPLFHIVLAPQNLHIPPLLFFSSECPVVRIRLQFKHPH
ncbi:hypothetical protein DL93DRAFT_1862052 [Clavulina sp. PMI_390]|nr:hypothetical protein DL93DRAFT_1862052 [Clavulina sp. PMI_390]